MQSKDNTCPTCHGSGQQEDTTGHPTAETPDAQPLGNVSGERVTILYKYVERPDGIYYLWKLPNDKEWHEKPTPYTQSPIVQYLHLSRAEYENHFHEALPSNNASESVRVDAPLTDSKPEKPVPNEQGCGRHFLQDYCDCEPSKPDQLREQLIKLGVKGDRQLPGVLALLATEYDRGKVEERKDLRQSIKEL